MVISSNDTNYIYYITILLQQNEHFKMESLSLNVLSPNLYLNYFFVILNLLIYNHCSFKLTQLRL